MMKSVLLGSRDGKSPQIMLGIRFLHDVFPTKTFTFNTTLQVVKYYALVYDLHSSGHNSWDQTFTQHHTLVLFICPFLCQLDGVICLADKTKS